MLRKENERNRRREVAGKNKTKDERDQDRDISEKIALGQAQPTTKDVMYDQRLFNQTSGLGSGFTFEDDDYNLYDKPLFTDRTAASIYKNVNRQIGKGTAATDLQNQLSDGEDAENPVEGVLKQKPDRGFDGTGG